MKNKIIITSTPVEMSFFYDIWDKEYYRIQQRKKRKEKLEKLKDHINEK